MNKKWIAVPCVFVIYICIGCNHYTEHKYTTYELAMNLGRQIEDPPVVHVESVPENLPSMIVYASIVGNFHGGTVGNQAWCLKKEAMKRGFEPDILIYHPLGSAYAGSTHQYIGGGSSISMPVYRPQAMAYCYRLCQSYIGLKWDDRQMITWVDEKTRVNALIQEGDTLISVNGQAVKRSGKTTTPFESEALRLKVGQELTLIWIRPGIGRMEGVTTAIEQRLIPSNITSIAVKRKRKKLDKKY